MALDRDSTEIEQSWNKQASKQPLIFLFFRQHKDISSRHDIWHTPWPTSRPFPARANCTDHAPHTHMTEHTGSTRYLLQLSFGCAECTTWNLPGLDIPPVPIQPQYHSYYNNDQGKPRTTPSSKWLAHCRRPIRWRGVKAAAAAAAAAAV